MSIGIVIDEYWEYDSHACLSRSGLGGPFHLGGDRGWWAGGVCSTRTSGIPRTNRTLCKDFTKRVGNLCTFCKSGIKNSRYKEHTVLCPPLIQWTFLSSRIHPEAVPHRPAGMQACRVLVPLAKIARRSCSSGQVQARKSITLAMDNPHSEVAAIWSGFASDQPQGRSTAYRAPSTNPAGRRLEVPGRPAQARSSNTASASALPDGPVARGGDLGRAPTVRQQSAAPHLGPTSHQAGRVGQTPLRDGLCAPHVTCLTSRELSFSMVSATQTRNQVKQTKPQSSNMSLRCALFLGLWEELKVRLTKLAQNSNMSKEAGYMEIFVTSTA